MTNPDDRHFIGKRLGRCCKRPGNIKAAGKCHPSPMPVLPGAQSGKGRNITLSWLLLQPAKLNWREEHTTSLQEPRNYHSLVKSLEEILAESIRVSLGAAMQTFHSQHCRLWNNGLALNLPFEMVVKRVLEGGVGIKRVAAEFSVSAVHRYLHHTISLSFFLPLYVSVFYCACSLTFVFLGDITIKIYFSYKYPFSLISLVTFPGPLIYHDLLEMR